MPPRFFASWEDITMDITAIIIAASIPSAITGFLFWLLEHRIQKSEEENKREREKRQKEIDKRDEQRREYETCQLNMIIASMALSKATAKAVQRIPDAHCNGDMDAALNYAEKIKNDQKTFLQRVAIENIDF